MAITNFIPTVWSENLYNQLEKKYIAVANCTREWEGDIKQCGDRVKICGIEPVSVFDYTKNTNLPDPVALSDNARELIINKAKAFNFQIDDIDKAQASVSLMNAAIHQAAEALANQADKYVYDTISNDLTVNNFHITNKVDEELVSEIISIILKMRSNGVREDLILEVPPKVAGLLYKAKLDLLSDNTNLFESGCIGSIAGCKVFVTHNVPAFESDGMFSCYSVLRTKRAVAFAEQLSEIEAYRPELRFADAVKGLHLYGAKVVRYDEVCGIPISFAE